MDLIPRTERFGGGDIAWLGSSHGVDAARTVTVDASALSAGDTPDGYIPSGFAVQDGGDGKVVPFDGGTLVGFVLSDTTVGEGDPVVAVVDHGRVKIDRLPNPVPSNVATSGSFVFIGGEPADNGNGDGGEG